MVTTVLARLFALTLLSPVQVKYEVVVMPTLPDEFLSTGRDINDCGQAVGSAARQFSASAWGYVPWKWSLATGKFELPVFDDHQVANAINEYGVIVGGSAFDNSTPWRWDNGSLTDLGVFGNYTTGTAWGVNDQGQIVGTLDGDNLRIPDAPFLFEPGVGMSDLWPGRDAEARGVNNSGQVALTSGNAAWRYTPGLGFENLGVPAGMYSAAARSINRNGDVVGQSSSRSGSTGDAFLYTDAGGMETIPTQNSRDVAWDVNRHGVVVGEGTGGGTDRAWIWSRSSGYADLNDQIDPALDLYLRRASAINDHGWILADGFPFSTGEAADYVLIPVTDRGGLELEVNSTRVQAGDMVRFDLFHGAEGSKTALVAVDATGRIVAKLRHGTFSTACRFQPKFRVPALPAGSVFAVQGFGIDRLGHLASSNTLILQVR